jgi:hypothetical protein
MNNELLSDLKNFDIRQLEAVSDDDEMNGGKNNDNGKNSEKNGGSNKITAEKISLLIEIKDNNLLRLVLNIIYEEMLKYEEGLAQFPDVSYCISLAMDKQKEEAKQEKNTKQLRSKWLNEL